MPAPLGNPPGPTGWPFIGVLPEFRRNPAEFYLKITQEYGDIAYFRIGRERMYLLNRPELIEEILVTSHGNFIKSRMLQRVKRLLGEGLLTSEGPLHLRQRRLAQPAFYRERLASYAATIVGCGEQARNRWVPGQTIDVAEEMMRLTLSVVGWTLFSRDLEGDAADIGQALTDVLSTFNSMLLPGAGLIQRMPLPSMIRARRAHKLLDEKVYGIIRERRQNPSDRGDLLSMLMSASEDGMTDTQLHDEALTIVLAGHETTATVLTWAWYLLSTNPEAEQKLRAEWAEVLGGRSPEFSDLPRLEYTERVFLEALRLYPPAWAIGRMALNGFRLFNYMIPAGSICVMSPYVMHRNPRFWPDAERFNPDRFTPEARASRPRFSYFPFGGGPRVCIGERFATMEGILLLAVIGQRWRFRLAPGQRIGIQPRITLRPRYGMKMIPERVVA